MPGSVVGDASTTIEKSDIGAALPTLAMATSIVLSSLATFGVWLVLITLAIGMWLETPKGP